MKCSRYYLLLTLVRFVFPFYLTSKEHAGRKRKTSKRERKKKVMSAVGFEPTPAYADQNTPPLRGSIALESGALDHSAMLTTIVLK